MHHCSKKANEQLTYWIGLCYIELKVTKTVSNAVCDLDTAVACATNAKNSLKTIMASM